MLPDLSGAHILIVVIIALVVVGPQDLPALLRKIGKFMGKMRGMANEFRASFDEMARQSELDELRKEVEAMRAAAQTATPDLGLKDLGLDDALKMDEGSYMSQWQASQDAAEAYAMTPLPTAEAAPAANVAKPRAKTAKPPEPAAKAAPKKAAVQAKPRAKKPPAGS
jgi:sec-independent protein translocase protein TatB